MMLHAPPTSIVHFLLLLLPARPHRPDRREADPTLHGAGLTTGIRRKIGLSPIVPRNWSQDFNLGFNWQEMGGKKISLARPPAS